MNKSEYLCPICLGSDRNRLIVSFLVKEGLSLSPGGTKVLQFAPSVARSNWVLKHCPQVDYETTNLFMEGVTFNSDIQDMNMISDETYDVIICSHVLEHVQDDRKSLNEMKRILRPDGKLIFLVPNRFEFRRTFLKQI